MARLKYIVKHYIVTRLAGFDTINEVVVGVRDDFGIEITRQQCEAYDPTKRIGKDLGKQWVDLFWMQREKTQNDLNDIALFHKSYRLSQLNKMYELNKKNPFQALKILKMAQMEMEDAYVKKRHRLSKKQKSMT